MLSADCFRRTEREKTDLLKQACGEPQVKGYRNKRFPVRPPALTTGRCAMCGSRRREPRDKQLNQVPSRSDCIAHLPVVKAKPPWRRWLGLWQPPQIAAQGDPGINRMHACNRTLKTAYLSEILVIDGSKDDIGINTFLVLLFTDHDRIAHDVVDQPGVSMGMSGHCSQCSIINNCF